MPGQPSSQEGSAGQPSARLPAVSPSCVECRPIAAPGLRVVRLGDIVRFGDIVGVVVEWLGWSVVTGSAGWAGLGWFGSEGAAVGVPHEVAAVWEALEVPAAFVEHHVV